MLRFRSLPVFAIPCLMAPSSAAAISATIDAFYVSPRGNDSWGGRIAEPNPAGSDGPFATLERARSAVRQLKASPSGLSRHVVVYLCAGTYYLDRPFELGPEDSGDEKHSITYAPRPAGRGVDHVVISGGRPIEGFREVEVNGRRMLAADLPDVREGRWYFTQLFVNNRRRPRPRLPREGCYQIAELIDVPPDTPWNKGQDRFRFHEGDMRSWTHLEDVDVVALHFWVESRMKIKSVDEQSRVVALDRPSTFRLTRDHDIGVGARYFVENVFEALDTPGQWYLDRKAGTLYYYPYPGEDTKNLRVVAPRLDSLVRVRGGADSGAAVHDVNFVNLRFAHTQRPLPPDRAGASQAAVDVPGALFFERAERVCVERCEVSQIGTYGIEFGAGCRGNQVLSCRILDMGAGGVKINEGSERTTVADCEIGDGGKIFMSAVGVWIGNSPHNRVAHNSIHDLDYTGVSVGWRWGYGESAAVDNAVEHNHIFRVGRSVLSDLGGIYTLGVSPGTVLRNNLIHDCFSYSYGGWGIYTDEGSTDIVIENNVVCRTKTGGFHQHYGRENIVRNNIFAFAKQHQLQRSRPEDHTSFIFERNIVYYDEGQLLGGSWGDDNYKMDYNLYWDASGRPVTFAGATIEQWRERGHDINSLIADPRFADPAKDDFTLAPDSPALRLGFRHIDVSRVGPRKPPGIWKPEYWDIEGAQ